MPIDLNQKIYVAGHNGMVGSAIRRNLQKKGFNNIILRSRQELDLTNQSMVKNFFSTNKIDQVYLAAARVGGIHANNTYPAEFIYQNLMIELNVIHEAYCSGVKKLLFMGSSCIYPKLAPQPMTEGALLSGKLELTNEPYAIAKIAGIKICESYNRQYGEGASGLDFRSIMPTNLYGIGDNYHPQDSHVVPALIRKFHEAKISGNPNVEIWGSGNARREFLYVDDLAEASFFIMNICKEDYDNCTDPMRGHINVGYGSDISIKDLATLISKIIGYTGNIVFNVDKLDGAPQKLLDSSIINYLGWSPKTDLENGLKNAYNDFLEMI